MTDDNSDQKVVTALDIIEQQSALEKEAQEVLPGKFEKCTYEQGYIRQTLYACKTCTPPEHEPAGMCYSCSIACHSDHELLELFPKRDFRCDCGLPGKFRGHPCALASRQKLHAPPNDKNQYNHNFRGHYCRCNEFYDPEKEIGTMFQCVICEDWFHDRCIGDMPETIDDFESYICRMCTSKYPFLVQNADKHRSIGLCKGNEKIHKWIVATDMQPSDTAKHDKDDQNAKENSIVETTGIKRKLDDAPSEDSNKRSKLNDTQSATQTRKCVNAYVIPEDCAAELFLNEGWRSNLCSCEECLQEFTANGLEFLRQEENTFEPEEDEDAGKSLFDVGMEHLMRMDRVKAIESARAYNRLSEQIREFLQGFKDSGEVVTEKDIKQFFAQKRLELKAQSH